MEVELDLVILYLSILYLSIHTLMQPCNIAFDYLYGFSSSLIIVSVSCSSIVLPSYDQIHFYTKLFLSMNYTLHES